MTADQTPDGWLPPYTPQGEVWRKIPGHHLYEVSSEGRVRTVTRTQRRGFHAAATLHSVELKQSIGGRRKNYKRVMLMHPKKVHAYVHHLVALAFIGPRPKGCEVLHGPAGSLTNSVSNIRYGDREENDMDRYVSRVADSLEGAPF